MRRSLGPGALRVEHIGSTAKREWTDMNEYAAANGGLIEAVLTGAET